MNHLDAFSDLGPDPDFVTRIGRRDPIRRQRGRGAGDEGARWIRYGEACRAWVLALAQPGQVKMQKIAALGGKRIRIKTSADERQAKTVGAWRRRL